MRDNRTEEAKRHIGEGAKVRMDEKGNIHIKRVSKSNIYIKNTADENGIGNDILKLPQGALEFGKGYLVRDDAIVVYYERIWFNCAFFFFLLQSRSISGPVFTLAHTLRSIA